MTDGPRNMDPRKYVSAKLPTEPPSRRNVLLASTALAATALTSSSIIGEAHAQQNQPAAASGRKPNILMIMADDIGWFNVSAYNLGIMGYRTPNIDRIAKEGALFTDWYGEQSCTAGRAAFITGQSPIRTGLTKVGLPGAAHRTARRRPVRRGSSEAARLRHRAVRQEPSRRPQRVSADRTRLRRIFRQSLPSQRRGGAAKSGLPQEPEVPDQVRAAGRAQMQGHRHRRCDHRSGLRDASASR